MIGKMPTYLDLSTIHIKPVTANEYLSGVGTYMDRNPHCIANYAEGAFCYVGGKTDAAVPVDLKLVLDFARISGASLVRFDCDAPELDGLPTYEKEWGL